MPLQGCLLLWIQQDLMVVFIDTGLDGALGLFNAQFSTVNWSVMGDRLFVSLVTL